MIARMQKGTMASRGFLCRLAFHSFHRTDYLTRIGRKSALQVP